MTIFAILYLLSNSGYTMTTFTFVVLKRRFNTLGFSKEVEIPNFSLLNLRERTSKVKRISNNTDYTLSVIVVL